MLSIVSPVTHGKVWSRMSTSGVPRATLEDGTVLRNLTEVAAGSRKEEERIAEAVAGHQATFSIATD